MGNWSKLKADEKVRVIKFAIQNGVSDIKTIRDTFNMYADGGHLKDGTRKEESSFIIKSNKTQVPTLLEQFETEENNVIDAVENLPIITLFDDNMLDKKREKQYKEELENISYWHPPYTTSKVGDFQNINTLLNKETDYIYHKQKIDDSHYIPFIPEKEINIKGAKISSNMLDSLFKYAEQFNIPKEIVLGLPMAETTLGYYPSYSAGFDRYDYFRDKGGVNPTDLLNYHQFYNSPYSSEFNYIVKQSGGNPIVYGIPHPIKDGLNTNEFTANLGTVDNGFWRITEGAPRESDDVVLPLWNVFNQYNDQLIKRRLPILEKQTEEVINENPYRAAFNYFLQGNYNPGDPNHTVNVYNRGKELLQLPIIKQILQEQAWKKSTGGPLYPFSFEKKIPAVRY